MESTPPSQPTSPRSNDPAHPADHHLHLPGPDWPAQATEFIVESVDKVRDRTTGTILTIAQVTVYGLLAGILGVVVAVLLIVGLIRLLDEVLPSDVWLAYLLLGIASLVGGVMVFRRRVAVSVPAAGNTTPR